jgi:muconolactone delta-isomerase
MRCLVLVHPKFMLPLDQLPAMTEGFAAWRERYRPQMEAFEFFAGSAGGFGILNVADEATLNQIMLEFPFALYSEIEVRPILTGDAALKQWQQAVASMSGQPR